MQDLKCPNAFGERVSQIIEMRMNGTKNLTWMTPTSHVFEPGSGMDFLKPEDDMWGCGCLATRYEQPNLRFVAGEAHSKGISCPRCHLFNVVLVLRARGECRYATRSRLDRPVKLMMIDD